MESFRVSTLLVLLILTLLAHVAQPKLVINSEQSKVVQEMRELVKDRAQGYQTTDSYLFRWLNDNDFNLNETMLKFMQTEQWRKDNKMDEITKESFPEFKGLSFSLDGRDKEGRTVVTASSGKADFRRILLTAGTDRYIRFHMSQVEKVARASAEAVYRSNGTVTDSRIICIVDLQGVSLKNHGCTACVQLLMKIEQLVQTHYPGLNVANIHINVPRSLLPVLEVVTSRTSSKQKTVNIFFGQDRAEWSAYILKRVPADQITYQFGGTKEN